MDSRQRFLEIMNFKKDIRTLKWEFGYWKETNKRWYTEGLQKTIGILPSEQNFLSGESMPVYETDSQIDYDIRNYFNFDMGWSCVPINLWFCPPYEEKILKEDDDIKIIIDNMGIKKRIKKDQSSMPQFLKYPVQKREDFERIKEERLNLKNIKKRFPKILPWLLEIYKNRNFPLIIGGAPFGFYSSLRSLLGFENLCYTLYSDIKLINNILDHLLYFYTCLLEEIIDLIEPKPDAVYIWEDMAYKNGPMISPPMFKEILSPYYKKLNTFFNSKGITNIIVDSDGNIEELIPLFMDCKITGILPFEIAAGMNLIKIRKKFPNLQIIGGVDKRNISGKELVNKEMDIVTQLIGNSGFIPHIDHLVPPNISWEDFKYYRTNLNKVIEDFK